MSKTVASESLKAKQDAVFKEYDYMREKLILWDNMKIRVMVFTITGWVVALGFSDKVQISKELIPIFLIAILLIGSQRTKKLADHFLRRIVRLIL